MYVLYMHMQFGLLLAVAAFAMAGPARADELPPPPPRTELQWNEDWPRVSVFEVMLSAAVTARNADLGAHLDGPNEAIIQGHVPLLDLGGRDLFRAGSASGRAGAKRLSDLGFRVLVLAPYAVDVGFGALVLHRNADVAAQLALIDFEVLTLAGMTQLLLSRGIGRARPGATCPQGGCKGDLYRSFDSGHAMASFAGAGLMCVHHEMLPLFGGGAPDTWACVWAVSAATITSSLRLVADEHWTSDVLVGAGLGWLYGYYLPKLLHFHTPKRTSGPQSAFRWMPSFVATPEGATLGALGTF